MKVYSQNKFLEMSSERQARVILDLIYKVESLWDDADKTKTSLSLLADYFQWANFFESSHSALRRLAQLQFKIDENLGLRGLLDLAVPLERFLDLAIKDEHIVRVKVGDDLGRDSSLLPLYFVLDHLRSSFNVGSLFRTAECFGVQHIYLVGYTPTPSESGVQKTAMGTDGLVSWSSHHHLGDVIDQLKEKSISIVALETSDDSISMESFSVPESVAFLVGNERFGLSQAALSAADAVVSIPMQGKKNSLNVANSLGIATFEAVRQWKK